MDTNTFNKKIFPQLGMSKPHTILLQSNSSLMSISGTEYFITLLLSYSLIMQKEASYSIWAMYERMQNSLLFLYNARRNRWNEDTLILLEKFFLLASTNKNYR